jgi:hypothetical protein
MNRVAWSNLEDSSSSSTGGAEPETLGDDDDAALDGLHAHSWLGLGGDGDDDDEESVHGLDLDDLMAGDTADHAVGRHRGRGSGAGAGDGGDGLEGDGDGDGDGDERKGEEKGGYDSDTLAVPATSPRFVPYSRSDTFTSAMPPRLTLQRTRSSIV